MHDANGVSSRSRGVKNSALLRSRAESKQLNIFVFLSVYLTGGGSNSFRRVFLLLPYLAVSFAQPFFVWQILFVYLVLKMDCMY